VPAAPRTARQSSDPAAAQYTRKLQAQPPTPHRPVTASTRSPATARSCTGPPGTLIFCQVAPPSRVRHRAGPNAHPSPALVNTIAPTAFPGGLPWYMSAGGAPGAGTANQVRPPSTVFRITTVRHVWTWSAHGVASSQPADADTKLADSTVSAPTPLADAAVAEPDRAAVPPAVPGAGWLAPSAGAGAAGAGAAGAGAAGAGAARPQAAVATSSAAVITHAGHERAAAAAPFLSRPESR
jgi:hypothetical protein